jgi:hypothetical protein
MLAGLKWITMLLSLFIYPVEFKATVILKFQGTILYLLPPLGSWKCDVILHTYIDEISWSPNETTN